MLEPLVLTVSNRAPSAVPRLAAIAFPAGTAAPGVPAWKVFARTGWETAVTQTACTVMVTGPP